MDYSALDGWILNLGVVPLLRSLALRLAPILPRLLQRLLYVARFFDTTLTLLSFKICILYFAGIVKYPIYASSRSQMVISLGEHREIPVSGLEKFTVGNNKIISYSLRMNSRILLIKGKKEGFTELIVWFGSKIKKIYSIYIVDKKYQQSLLRIIPVLESIGLTATPWGNMLRVEGRLDKMDSYLLLNKLRKNNKNILHFKGSLDPGLRNKIIGDIYYYFFEEHLDHIVCDEKNFRIICHYSGDHPSKKVFEYIDEKLGVVFLPLSRDFKKNLVAKMKIIQMERLDGHKWGWGLEQLNSPLGAFFLKDGLRQVMEKNQVFLQKQNVHFSVLAEPEILLVSGKTAEISVGAEIPFNASSSTQSVVVGVKWKFSGLKVKLHLNKTGRRYELDFSCEFTDFVNSSVRGNKESSTVVIDPGIPVKLFQIGLRTKAHQVSEMPWIADIPILGSIFKSKSRHENYKKIIGIILLESR